MSWLEALLKTSQSFNSALEKARTEAREEEAKKNKRTSHKLDAEKNYEEKILNIDYEAEETLDYFLSSMKEEDYDEKCFEECEKLKVRYIPVERKIRLFSGFFESQRKRLENEKKQKMLKWSGYYTTQDQPLKAEFTIAKGGVDQRFSLQKADLDKLKPNIDLNDTIIDNYIKILKLFLFAPEITEKTFFLSTFFMGQLMGDLIYKDMEQQNKETEKKNFEEIQRKVKENYHKVKNWTKKVDIFEMDYLIIPINSNNHWNCIIVLHPNSLTKENHNCRIIGLDSMFEMKSIYYDAVKIYLLLKISEIDKSFELNSITTTQLLVPRQTNHHDCGLFVLCYIERIFSNSRVLNDIENVSKTYFLDLFPREFVYALRYQLKELFAQLMIESNREKVKLISHFFSSREKIISEATISDYDLIDESNFEKYCKLSPTYQDEGEQKGDARLMLRFYLDPDINYYEQDEIRELIAF